jgi:hypothetical protein
MKGSSFSSSKHIRTSHVMVQHRGSPITQPDVSASKNRVGFHGGQEAWQVQPVRFNQPEFLLRRCQLRAIEALSLVMKSTRVQIATFPSKSTVTTKRMTDCSSGSAYYKAATTLDTRLYEEIHISHFLDTNSSPSGPKKWANEELL